MCTAEPIKLSALFGGRRDLILIPNMGQKCVYCTLWADGFNGVWRHLPDRAALVVSSPDEPAEMKKFAASRGWAFPMVTVRDTAFARDMRFAKPDGGLNDVWRGVGVPCE